ncbi:MAG: endolytic transglycosylase MltG [Acidobacteriota bacterium]|nr:endolytic transglycosylase MltG [Acidobacteriota bacterium]
MSKGKKRVEENLKRLFLFLVVSHVVVIGGYLYYVDREVYRERSIDETARQFSIDPGTGLNDVLEDLADMNLAPEPIFVRLSLAVRQRELVVKRGTYQLPEKASTWSLLELFDQGKVQLHRVTVPEGLDKWQTAELLGAQRWGDEATFLRLVNDPTPISNLDPKAEDLEGYLFPETYSFPESATPAEIIQAMVNQFLEHASDMESEREEAGMSLREWVAMASLVEEESASPEERPVISGVFHNRLKRGMLLQCDPTIIYSLKLDGVYRGKIYRSEIRRNHPYNTYVKKGLPPGPIANPGLGSLEAALRPGDTPYLYFVARDDGLHHFSRTLTEHNRAVRKYRRKGR